MKTTLKERLLAKVHIDQSGCWLWQGRLQHDGYGEINVNRIKKRAHRIAWQLFRGPVPPELDHLCRVRKCVNPDHLEPVDHRTNCRRGDLTKASDTHCKHGHLWSPETVVIKPNGARECRECQRVVNRRCREQRRFGN